MLDWDGTYTRDPTLWDAFIKISKFRGHKVYIVTSRGEDWPLETDPDVPVIFCNFRAKKEVCDEQGISIDIWIDNDPLYINKGFAD